MQERLSFTAGHSLPYESSSSDVPQSVSPPPYEPTAGSSLFLAETTTTRTEVVTTTTTTTQLFSLSPWRKRSFANILHQSADIGANGRRETTLLSTRPSTLVVEKELPPTPPHEYALNSNISLTSGASTDRKPTDGSFTKYFTSPPNSPSVSGSQPTVQSTAVLARAGLGLGLPHVLPHASTSSTTRPPAAEYGVTVPTIHRAQKTSASLTRGRPTPIHIPFEEDRRRRTRGVSFGTSSFLKFGSADVKGKKKEKELDYESPAKGPPKTLSRRPSFWSRKQSDTVALSTTTPKNTRDQLAPILTLPPISPFDTSITITPSPPFPPQHNRSLSRSYTERGDPYQTTEAIPSRRPATANPSYGPCTSRSLTVESLGAPEVLPVFMRSSSRPQTSTTGQRPRSLTNPPVLCSPSPDQSILLKSPLPSGSSTSSQDIRGRPNSTTSPRYSLDQRFKIFSSGDTQGSGKSQTLLSTKSQMNSPLPLNDQESPALYLLRLQAAVSKAEVAGILASSADTFHVQALRTYIGQFDFINDPLDVALRRLLMEVGLPRETQQIDRVVEAFAGRYVQCNPTLFTSEDHPYILAFSLIMLHTDAFNKSNKRKMTRAAYVKNARLPGVASDVLDCFYDNIVFAPFIFIEDPVDVNGQRGVASEAIPSRPSGRSSQGGAVALMKGSKIDPYYFIANNLLDPLRLDVGDYVPTENPYSYEGTAGPWDENQLRLAFAKAGEMEVGAADHGLMSPFFGLGMGGSPPCSPGNIITSPESRPSSSEVWTLKVTKVGLLNRKDDILEGGRKALNRKWKLWSVVLTGSQLLFFRDPSWSTSMLAHTVPSDGHVIFPQQAVFKPDEVLSVKDAVAVIDKFYVKYDRTLRFVLGDGRQILLQASEENELNEWIARINYAGAFKSAGVRMRPLDMSGVDVKTGIAVVASHLHGLQHHGQSKTRVLEHVVTMSPCDSDLKEQRYPSEPKPTLSNGLEDVDIDVPVVLEIDGTSQFQAAFDEVKADLAVGCQSSGDEASPSNQVATNFNIPPILVASGSSQSEDPRLPSRSEIMRAKIHDLESWIAVAQAQLDADMRFVRNVATLTPFQKSTRDRLVVALQAVSKRVMQVRLDMTKLTCHHDVLSNDLASEGSSWRRAKSIALQAAQETPQNCYPGNPSEIALSSNHEILGMDASASRPSSQYLGTPLSCRPASSLCESFHSAIDFGPAWALAEEVASSEFPTLPPLFDSPKLSSSVSFPHTDVNSTTSSPRPHSLTIQSANRSSRTSIESGDHEKFYSAREKGGEQAEAWNKTRCAQRVSLVRLPSYIQMPIGGKHNDRT